MLTLSIAILRTAPASKSDEGSSRYWTSSSEVKAWEITWNNSCASYV